MQIDVHHESLSFFCHDVTLDVTDLRRISNKTRTSSPAAGTAGFFNNSETPNDNAPIKSLRVVRSQSHISIKRRRSLSSVLRSNTSVSFHSGFNDDFIVRTSLHFTYGSDKPFGSIGIRLRACLISQNNLFCSSFE
ncbi:hypothetical protein DERP_007131 [Dermatophagoides pteronyssinus]|uniref:Uncharacterized protein n=1 Tax=Dermatophagoides pteronyssinus TaxID=6956 RepID=A0ABQ8JV54_DERPT|nr:hypothetical protein DERP_007131 [Dermatophagoides pteronyssinus]